MDVNKPEVQPGIGGLVRVVAALSVLLVAGIGVLAVLGIIPQDALQEWATKGALVALIVVGAGVALVLLSRSR